MARVNASITPAERDSSRTVITLGAVIAALYFGQDIFVPIALAILLSFALAPAVRKLHGLGVGRVFPVLLATFLAFSIVAGLAAVLAAQIRDLAADLPRYEQTVTKKIESVKSIASSNALQSIEDILHNIDRTATGRQAAQTVPSADTSRPAADATRATPIQVEVQQPPSTPVETIRNMLSPLLHPLATGGIVVIFTLFILLQREDLRNRLIRLFGASDLQRATEAINDGARRLSRYLLTQLLINAAAGFTVGLAAFLIGVPNPTLWGILFGCMRFVPYLGPIIGGVLPCVFAAAVSPGWSVAIWMAGTIVLIEVAVGQFLEPLLYGHHTGLSPVAVVMAATFWTVLWGPVGLLLSTPLTVCLVVVGRHVEQLEFLDVLLGDRPPLTQPETFYQRMLANDPMEVVEQAQECLKSMSLIDYYDGVMLPGLLLAQGDVSSERLPLERQVAIRDSTEEVIEDLGEVDTADETSAPGRWRKLLRPVDTANRPIGGANEAVSPHWAAERAVLCIGGRGPLDDCPALMVAQALRSHGVGARAESFSALSKNAIGELDLHQTRLICVSCLDGSSSAYLRFALRRIRRHAPDAKILIGAWWLQAVASQDRPVEPHEHAASNEPFATTILDAVHHCLAEASALTDEHLVRPEAPAIAMAQS